MAKAALTHKRTVSESIKFSGEMSADGLI